MCPPIPEAQCPAHISHHSTQMLGRFSLLSCILVCRPKASLTRKPDCTKPCYLVFVVVVVLAAPRACRILVPQPEIEPVPPAVEVRSPDHWTTTEFPTMLSERPTAISNVANFQRGTLTFPDPLAASSGRVTHYCPLRGCSRESCCFLANSADMAPLASHFFPPESGPSGWKSGSHLGTMRHEAGGKAQETLRGADLSQPLPTSRYLAA